jgi:hypothetical protein
MLLSKFVEQSKNKLKMSNVEDDKESNECNKRLAEMYYREITIMFWIII